MGRPPLPLGTHGEINVVRVGPKRFEARCRFRTRNGAMKRLAARGETAPGAKRAHNEKLAKHKVTATKGKINRDTRFSEATNVYKENLRHQVNQRQMSPNTRRAYESILKIVEGYLGEMRMGELEESVDVVDETIKDIHNTMSYENAKKARTVISGICQLGIRRRAITSNPVRSIEALTRGHGTSDTGGEDTTAEDAVPAMTEAQIQDMFRGLEEFCRTKVQETDRSAGGWASAARCGRTCPTWPRQACRPEPGSARCSR